MRHIFLTKNLRLDWTLTPLKCLYFNRHYKFKFHLKSGPVFFSTCSSRMIEIQTQMSERAVELLNLPEGQACYLLDVG